MLALLIQGHTAWLTQMGVHGLVFVPEQFSPTPTGLQLLGMASFRIAFLVAFIITGIETFTGIYRLLRPDQNGGTSNFLRMTANSR